MKYSSPLRNIGRVFTLFVIGSVVVTRSTAAPVVTEDSKQYELAWISVREGLADTAGNIQLPVDVRRLAEQGFGDDFELRIRTSYLDLSAEAITELDGLWLDNLVAIGADSDTMERFLVARSTALSEVDTSEDAGPNSADKWRSFLRVFKRAPYDSGG